MSATYTITRAKAGKQKPNPHGGTLYIWYVGLKNGDEEHPDVYWQSKRQQVAVGDEVFGRVDTSGDYGPRFYAEQQEGSQTPSVPAQSQASYEVIRGSEDARPPVNEYEQRDRRIVRQHSQEMALRWAAILQSQGRLSDTYELTDLKTLIDHFDQDARS